MSLAKLKHHFVYGPKSMHNDFHHTISFRVEWRGNQYGEFITLSDTGMENIFFHMRRLVCYKHGLQEAMNEAN